MFTEFLSSNAMFWQKRYSGIFLHDLSFLDLCHLIGYGSAKLFIYLSSIWGINQLQIDPWLVESLDVNATYVKPRDMESQPYIHSECFFNANIIVFNTLKDYSNFCFPPWWNNKDWIYPTSWHRTKIKETLVFRQWAKERTSRKSIK